MTLEAGKAYVVELKGKDTGDGTLEDPYLDGVYDADGTVLAGTWRDNGGEGRNSLVTFTAEADGTYYVAAGAAGKHKGTYTLSVTEPPDDFAADVSTSGKIAVGGTATGEIEQAGDSDWFAVTLEAGKAYVVELKGKDTGDGTLKDPYLDGIYDSDGTVLAGTQADNGGEGRNSRTTVTVEEGGTYYVAAAVADGGVGTYTLSVAQPAVDPDLAADVSTTGTVTVGGTATGEIEQAGDSDWFAVTLEAGKTYVVELKGKDTGDGTLEDPYLDGIYDSDGTVLAGTWRDNGGEGRNSLVTFTAEAGGTYYVAAGAAGKHKGTYTLSVTEPLDDFAADAGTTGTVAVGGTATGEIERSWDRDWFAVTLEADKTYVVELKGKDTGDGTLEDPYLDGIYDSDGTVLAGTQADNGGEGRNSRATVTVEEGGTYYVAAAAAGAAGKHKGTYTLSVTQDPDLAADVSTSGRIAVGGTATGEIERSGDSDWFAVTLEAGKTYVIELKGRPTRDGTLKNPYLDGIYDSNGSFVHGTWDDDGGKGRNSLVRVTAEADGTYYVAAGAYERHTGTYTLSVTQDPDLAADVSTTGTVAVGGTATGEIERSGDSDWFAVTLEAGKTYVVELKGRPTRDGTLKNPYLDGIYDSNGSFVHGTWDDDGGKGRNSLVTLAAEADGTYYVAAGAYERHTGTYTLSVVEDAM